MLNDKKIRDSLSSYLGKKSPKPLSVIHELHFHNGNAIADVVTLHQAMHAYEIKGQTDNVSRVLQQADFYNVSFPRLTLVTTKNHLAWAIGNLPSFWGILLAVDSGGKVRFIYKRGAKQNPFFCKKKALLMLWKEELICATCESKVLIKKSDSRSDLAEKLDKALGKAEVAAIINSIMARRILKTVHDKSDV